MARRLTTISPPIVNTHNSKIQDQSRNYRTLLSSLTMASAQHKIFNNRMACSASELLRLNTFSHARKNLCSTRVFVVPKATVEVEDFIIEPATNVKFITSLKVPGASSSLSLVGKGFREKKIAIVGVKVYAAALYINPMMASYLDKWSGKSKSQIEQDIQFFKDVFEAPVEKSLQIVLVRNIDGETFWNALDEALSQRLRNTGLAEQKALTIFRETFQGRSLKKGTIIYLSWPKSSTMLVSISSDGSPSAVDATIESLAVASALFDVYFGSNPVSPSLKESCASGLASMV